jgi:hypothetical protein
MRTLRWKELHGTLLIVHAPTLPDADEWAALMRAGLELGPGMRRCLVLADIMLSPRQRGEIADTTKAAGTEAVAVVTNSPVGRMIVTGLGWVTGIHKGFDTRDLDAALDFLKVLEADRPELLCTAHDFAAELGHTSLSLTLANHPLVRARATAS